MENDPLSARDAATDEKLWKDPDWICPQCGYVNMAIRGVCRNFNCGFDSEVAHAGLC